MDLPVHERLFNNATTASIHKDCRVPTFQEDSLDIALEAKYNQHDTFNAGPTAVLKQGHTEEIKHGSLKHKVLQKKQMQETKQSNATIVNHPTSQHFGRECMHGDIHSQATNQEIVMAEDNNTLYATNRGMLNTVTVFGIHSNGTLTQKQQIDAPDYPRGMTLVHGGRVLLVAGQSKTSVRSYTVGSDGTLTQASDLTEGLPPHPAAFMMFEPAAVVV